MAKSPAPVRVDPQEVLRLAFEERLPLIINLLDKCLGRTRTSQTLCKCGRRVQVDGPDAKALTEITKLFFELGLGKTPTMERKAPKPMSTKPLGEMSHAELLALVAAEEAEAAG